jgi:hypothetical protein
MGRTVDHLEVRKTPECQQIRPGQVAVVGPSAEERNAMVDLGSSEQPGPRYRTTAVLQLGEDGAIVVRVRPHFPGDDTARMPHCALIRGTGAFPLSMPAKPEDWLAADDTLTSAGGARLPERQRRSSVAGWQIVQRAEPPLPSGRCATVESKASSEAVGTQRMSVPVAIDGSPECPGYPARPQRVYQNSRRQDILTGSCQSGLRFAIP